MSPILPLQLKSAKPKCIQYPKVITTVGDEFRAVRIDRGLTQKEVGVMLSVNRNFVYELEMYQHQLTIYSLHKAYQFLGYVPEVLKIDESRLRGQLFTHRIQNGFTYTKIAKLISIDKGAVANFERGRNIKGENKTLIFKYLNINM
jgi:transcriptional regulator with XRE-family HTH domain